MMRSRWSCFLPVFALAFPAAPAYGQRAIVLVRHAEKETDPQKLRGLSDEQVPLNGAGALRAGALVGHLKGFGIEAVYTTGAARTQQTAKPLADALGIKPEVLSAETLGRLGKRHREQVVLIVAHSGGSSGVPQIIDAITGAPQGVVIRERDEFDNLFVLVPRRDGAWGLARARYGPPNPLPQGTRPPGPGAGL